MILGIASGKGGVGKTSFAVNLALALKLYSVDTIIVDGDLTTGSVALALGNPLPSNYIQDFFRGKKNLDKILFSHPLGIKVIASELSISSVKEYPLKTSLKKLLKKRKEFVIVDMPATIGKETMYWLNVVDKVVVIVTPELNSLAAALKLSIACEMLHQKVAGIIINKSVQPQKEKNDVNKIFGNIPILGILRYDENVRESMAIGKPILTFAKYSPYSIDMMNLVAMLTNKNKPKINPLLTLFGPWIKEY
ncbi:MAG: P-loop NTPase [Candidatus Micrarchaeota archaeon]|nr:P-loop NTPase [Candidatus Micrarchaeota archaeon]